MRILALNEGLDASAVLCEDGRVVFAVQEERLTREKGCIGFPRLSILRCLEERRLSVKDIDRVCFSNLHSPGEGTRQQFLEYYRQNATPFREVLAQGNLSGVSRRLIERFPYSLQESIGDAYRRRNGDAHNVDGESRLGQLGLGECPLDRFHHHSNHAASAYYGLCRNFDEPHLVFSLDGGGDDACAHVYVGEAGRLQLIASTPNGHSVGNIYACVTYLMGMRPHEHEYKLMGLAPYPDPQYAQPLVEKFRGYLWFDPENPLRFKRRIPERTNRVVPRMVEDFRFARFDTLASAVQIFCEELLEKWICAGIARTGIARILAAGGVFMNVKANKRIAELPQVKSFDVFPSCGDETLPFGAAWLSHVRAGGSATRLGLDDFYLGPDAGADIEQVEAKYGDVVAMERLSDPECRAAELLAAGEIVARCSGPMEFGARALGNRSILADPSKPEVINEINRMIKQRDFWMPFAPAMLAEKASDYVTIPPSLAGHRVSPYMMHTFATTDRRRDLIAGVHNADGTARAQIVWKDLNPRFHALIQRFGELTGRFVVLNTSFNLHGYPIVCGAMDAVDVMLRSSLKYLIVDDFLFTKRQLGRRDT